MATSLVVLFVGCLVVLFWVYVSQAKDLNLVVGLVGLCLAGLPIFLNWNSVPSGNLAWDGQGWHWNSTRDQVGVAEYEVIVAADFQHILLLRLENPANARLWFWAERRALPERWMDLRRAIYSPRRHRPFGAVSV